MAKDQADPYLEDLMENSYFLNICSANLSLNFIVLSFHFFTSFQISTPFLQRLYKNDNL